MAKKLTRKEKYARNREQGTPVSASRSAMKEAGSRGKLKRNLSILLALIAFALYANSLRNQYVLDDFGLISENTQTRQGVSAWPQIFSTSYRTGMNTTDFLLYRPLSKALFALEWQIAPDEPALGHWMNVLWFAATCVLLFHVLSVLLKGRLLVPFLTALLFAAHPLHTEVVANIKGRDEILCLFFCLLTLLWIVHWVERGKKKWLVASAFAFFLAYLSKESAITWLAVIPLALYFFTDSGKNKYISSMGGLLIVTFIFLVIRKKVLGSVESPIPLVDNHLVGIDGFFMQRVNAIFLMGVYMYKFIFPFPLMADASYSHFPVVGPGDWRFLVPFAVNLGLLVFALMKFRKRNLFAFGILYFFITVSIVSNVVVLIGTNYGERLMFTPSLGFCFCLALLLGKLADEQPAKQSNSLQSFFSAAKKPAAVTLLILLFFGYRTVARNPDWYNNDSLYFTDVKTVPESAHLRFYIGNHITSEEQLALLPDSAAMIKQMKEGIAQLTKAIEIYPKYADAYQRRGYIYFLLKDFTRSDSDYVQSLFYNPTQPVTHNNYGSMLFDTRRYGEAMDHFRLALHYNPLYAHAANNLASVYGVMGEGERDQANADPANREQHLKAARENFENAIQYFKKAIQIDPDYVQPYLLLAITYRNIGDAANADRYSALANQVKRKKGNAYH